MLEWLEMTSYAAWVRESLYGWAIMLTIHAFGNAVVVGVFAIIALRMLGLFQNTPYTSLKVLIPLVWIGVVTQVVSGFSLFLTKPPRYGTDTLFLIKMAFVLGGTVVTLQYQKILAQESAAGPKAVASARSVKFGVLCAFLWAGVLVMGRLTAYLGQLYDV